MTFTDEQVAALTAAQLLDYLQNYIWYSIDSDTRLVLMARYLEVLNGG